MRKIVLVILIFFTFFSCNTESGSDCFKTSGVTTTNEYTLEDFSKVIIHEGIELEIKQGTENNIQITYGKNIIDNIKTEIINDKLSISNTTSCKLLKDVKPAKIILTVINISEIRNASQYQVFSNEIIRFESLTLISENHLVDYVNVGDFNIIIENIYLNVVTNNISNFTIKGSTTNLSINFAAGQGKFRGEELIAQNIYVFHRGNNNIFINPILQLTGEIRSTGDIISINKPPTVAVEEFYTGQLIFRNKN